MTRHRCARCASILRAGFRSAALGGAALCAAWFAAGVAAAQQASPVDTTASGALDDIIVTAEKRSESLEKVPMSIVAYSAEALAETGVQDFSELAARIRTESATWAALITAS